MTKSQRKKIKELYIRLGKQLQESRNALGLSQSQLAQKLKYNSPQYVSNWERGKCLPPAANLKKIAKHLGIDHEKLINEYSRVLYERLIIVGGK